MCVCVGVLGERRRLSMLRMDIALDVVRSEKEGQIGGHGRGCGKYEKKPGKRG